MQISTEIGSISKIVGEERAVELCAKAGFDAWDFSMSKLAQYDFENNCLVDNGHPLNSREYLAFARRLKQIGLDNGIVCNQSHAPFPMDCKAIRDSVKRAIECTAEAGGKICVVHPDNDKGPEENAIMYREFVEFSKDYGVKIATENMWNWDPEENIASFAACATPESFCQHVDIVGSEYMTACLDIGHAEMKGNNTSAVEMIRALGPRISALHIHDNDKWHDNHALPLSLQIDYVPILKALREIGYNGYFTLEAYRYIRRFAADNIFKGVRVLAASARKLADMYENL